MSVVWALTVGIGIALGLGLALHIVWRADPRRQSARAMVREAADQTVWIVDGDRILDATDSARHALTGLGLISHAQTLLNQLVPSFPTLPETLSTLSDTGNATITSPQRENQRLEVEQWGDLIRIALCNGPCPDTVDYVAPVHLGELDLLRATVNDAPYLLWQENDEGEVIWANTSYMSRLTKEGAAPNTWPLRALFETDVLKTGVATTLTRRLRMKSEQEVWFDVTRIRHDQTHLFFACPADEIVKAERSLHDFVQTLTKTFAHLPVGLAIFNKRDELTLFNPALTDLFDLPIDMLIAHPNIVSFFDRLRELRMVPEQKNYAEWRDRFANLHQDGAHDPLYESWALPHGATYRVTAYPHREGATAFMFEDITRQLSTTRKMRSELERHSEVLDKSAEAIGVFEGTGELSYCNAAYRTLWKTDPSRAFTPVSIADCKKIWGQEIKESAFLETLQQRMRDVEHEGALSETITMRDGAKFEVRLVPLADRRLMVGFLNTSTSKTPKQRRLAKA